MDSSGSGSDSDAEIIMDTRRSLTHMQPLGTMPSEDKSPIFSKPSKYNSLSNYDFKNINNTSQMPAQ